MKLDGKVCLVTGGTSGIGAATALEFAKQGAHIVVAARALHSDALKTIQSETDVKGTKLHFIQADISKRDDCHQCVEEVITKFGAIDVLVHSAGGPASGNLLKVSEETWMEAFDTHIHAIFHLCRAAVPTMKDKGEGAIVLVSSVAGLRGCMDILSYSVAKGALPQFTRALGRELAEYGIRVNCVSPGFIRTPFHSGLSKQQAENNVQNRIPLHREGKPEDVASAIRLLAENDFITGENIVVDGGMTMRIV